MDAASALTTTIITITAAAVAAAGAGATGAAAAATAAIGAAATGDTAAQVPGSMVLPTIAGLAITILAVPTMDLATIATPAADCNSISG